MIKNTLYLFFVVTLVSSAGIGCESDKSSTDSNNQGDSLPYSWLSNFEKVDSGNRDLEETVQNLGNSIPIERTVRIEHSSTNINSKSVKFYYDILIVNNNVPRSAPISMGVVKARTFAAEFLQKDGYNDESIREVIIKISANNNSLEVGKNYEGVLEIKKDLYEKIERKRNKSNVSVSIKHLLIRQTRSLYSFEI